MLYKTDSHSSSSIKMSWFKYIVAFTAISTLGACAHPITINPSTSPQRTENSSYSTKVAGYVMTDTDRDKQVTTEGGGSEKVNYFPYKDLEKGKWVEILRWGDAAEARTLIEEGCQRLVEKEKAA